MNYSPAFSRGRTIVFSTITLLCLLWVIALSVIVFSQWDFIDRSEKSFLAAMIVMNTLTVIGLPILILVDFKPYLDGARIFLLFVAHIGMAVTFVSWFPNFECPTEEDIRRVCHTINTSIMVLNFVVPGIFMLYAVCLGIYSYLRYMEPPSEPEADEIPEPKPTEETRPQPLPPLKTPATHPEWAGPQFVSKASVIPSPLPRQFWDPQPYPSLPPWQGAVPSVGPSTRPRVSIQPLPKARRQRPPSLLPTPTSQTSLPYLVPSPGADKRHSRPPSSLPSSVPSSIHWLPPRPMPDDRRPLPPNTPATARSSRQWAPPAQGGGDRMSHLSQLVIMSSSARSDATGSVALPSPTSTEDLHRKSKRLTKSRIYFTPV